MRSSNFFSGIITYLFILLLMIAINFLFYFISNKLNYSKENKLYHKNVIIYGGIIPLVIYLGLNFLSFCGKFFIVGDVRFQNVIFERVLSFFIIVAFLLIKINYVKRKNKVVRWPFPYKKNDADNKYYISDHYILISKDLKIATIAFCIVFAFVESIFVFNNISLWVAAFGLSEGILSFILNYIYIINVAIIFLILNEIAVFLDGEAEPVKEVVKEAKVKEDRFLDMINEYKEKFKEHLLLTLEKDDDLLGEKNIEKDDYIYSKIFTPIIEGENIIIETETLSLLNDIVPPLINLLFATNRRMVFITESDSESRATFEWLKECNVVTNNTRQVVEILTEDSERTVISDTNVDICIGTVDLMLENRDILKNVDTIFSVNIDNIIVDRSINLSIMTKILSESKNKNVQYILFANELNGLQQTIEATFYSQNFNYQVVRNKVTKNFYSMFYAKERGRLQKEILPAIASETLGPVLPLLVTPVKYNFDNLYAFSSDEPYRDELKALHVNALNLKQYVKNNNVIEIEDKIAYLQNEHFVKHDENMVVAYDDTENNLVLILKNYLKYANSRMLINIVSDKYLLRDYMIDNIDFLIQNNEFVSKIVPQHKDGKKLLLFKLLNEMIIRPIEEETLIQELCKISSKVYNNMSFENAENFVKKELTNLINEVFGCQLYIDTYLSRELETKTSKKRIYIYRLLEEIKDELPETLFRQIKFIASDQKAKVLRRIPLYEMYQNYAIGQYVVFDGKSYVIDSMDYGNGVVNLIYNDRFNAVTYRFKKDVEIEHLEETMKTERELDFHKIEFLKHNVIVDAKVTYAGYFEFDNGIAFNQGAYKYHNNNYNGTADMNRYINQKAMILTFTSDETKKIDAKTKTKIGMTLAFLINEVATTIYNGSNQYLIVRAIINDKIDLYNEIVHLYSPVILDKFEDSIAILIMEDTELEKGVLDSFSLKLETTILPLLTDYLEWLLNDKNNQIKNYQMQFANEKDKYKQVVVATYNQEKISFYENNKFNYLKLGNKELSEIFDLKKTLEILKLISSRSENSITNTRRDYLSSRKLEVVEEPKEKKDVSNTKENAIKEERATKTAEEIKKTTKTEEKGKEREIKKEEEMSEIEKIEETNKIEDTNKTEEIKEKEKEEVKVDDELKKNDLNEIGQDEKKE